MRKIQASFHKLYVDNSSILLKNLLQFLSPAPSYNILVFPEPSLNDIEFMVIFESSATVANLGKV